MLPKYKILFSFIFMINALFSQNEHNVWYFGCGAGINFNGVTPQLLTDSPMCAEEGVSSISDSQGNLLFYSNGINVWNKNHFVMPNGSGLAGGNSSTQSCLIIKRPGYLNRYYVFTTAHQGGALGLCYSEIDMSLACSLGDVNENKNIPIQTPVCEKLTAILHPNGRDYWIVTHEYNSNVFYCYLLNSDGLNLSPVTSQVGNTLTGYNYMGYLKASNNGSKIAMSIGMSDLVQVFDFNNFTGEISNEKTLNNFSSTLHGVYGLEFSPNNNYLYLAEHGNSTKNYIYQYDLQYSNPTLLNNSRITIDSISGFFTGALQIASDGKIYHSIWNHNSLSVIESPDSLGVACNYINNAFSLAPKYSYGGLPNIPNKLNTHSTFIATDLCFNDSTSFSVIPVTNIDSAHWEFDDPNSGILNYSNSASVKHKFTQPGTYFVKLITYNLGVTDTIMNYIIIRDLPSLNLGNDTILCLGQTMNLNVDLPLNCGSIIWQDGTNDTIYHVNQSGEYHVKVTENGCNAFDTVLVKIIQYPVFNLGNDSNLCKNQTLPLNVSIDSTTITWQDGSNNNDYLISETGTYFIQMNKMGCISYDSIEVNYLEYPEISLGNDTVLCLNETLLLGPVFGTSILWNDGSQDSLYAVMANGLYFVESYFQNCLLSDSINVEFIDCEIPPFEVPNVFTPNGDSENDLFLINFPDELILKELKILNRWGSEMFQTNNKQEFWNGIECADGVYFWSLNYVIEEKEYKRTGFVHLVR